MKKRLVVALAAILTVCALGLTACGGSEYKSTDISKIEYYNAIQSYSVSGNETTIKAKVNIVANADLEVTAVIAPHAQAGQGSAADNNAAFKTVDVSITGSAKATYETALAAKEENSDIEYNNPKNLEGMAIRIMRTGRTAANATASAYDFETLTDTDVGTVGIAASTAMEKIVGYYRYCRDLKAAFNGVKVNAKAVALKSTFTSLLELHTDTSTTDPIAFVTNVWELKNSYIIVASSTSSSHDQHIMVMLEIGKDNKIKNTVAPLTHVSEYFGGNKIEGNDYVYLSALRANLSALKGVDITNKVFAAKGQAGSITNITTNATLTTNVTTNAVNCIIDYYANAIKA